MTPAAAARPDPAQEVALEVSGFGRLLARVEGSAGIEDAAASTLTLTVITPGPPPAGPATIEFTTSRGLHRLAGTVAPDADVVRFEQRLDPRVEQRREFVRAQAMVEVRLRPDARPGHEVIATALNVSGGGMLLAGGHGMEPGEGFGFVLALPPDGTPVTGRGRVVRESRRGSAGVAFEQVSEETRDRVVRFVFERHRHDRLVAG